MKKQMRWMGLGVLLVALYPAGAHAMCGPVLGDVNQSGETNVADVQCTILVALNEQNPTGFGEMPECMDEAAMEVADLQCDGSVNVVDVVLSITYALEAPLSVEIDANQDACPDSCDPLEPLPPTQPGAAYPEWSLLDYQPASGAVGTTYGLEAFEGVTVVMLLASY